MSESRNLAIIPARGGSKRIPKKNIKDFNGKPIIAYSIEAALSAGLFNEVMVSTDDAEIAEIAKHYGASVPFLRTRETSGDFATTIDVLLEVYKTYKNDGRLFENVCCIYACAPFVTSTQLKKALDLLLQHSASTIFPVIQYGHPIQRALQLNKEFVSMVDESNLTARTQDFQPRFHDAGQFYWLTAASLLSDKKLITNKTIGLKITDLEAQDIDNEMDWKLAEIKFHFMNTYLKS